MIGGLIPTVLATLYFWQAGALPVYLDANLRANVAYLDSTMTLATVLARLRFGLLPLVALLPWPIVLVTLFRDLKTRERYATLGVWLVLWLIGASVDVAAPMKLWKHYFNALVPPLCLIAGLSMELLVSRAQHRQRWLLGSVIVAVYGPLPSDLMVKHIPNSWAIERTNVPRGHCRLH